MGHLITGIFTFVSCQKWYVVHLAVVLLHLPKILHKQQEKLQQLLRKLKWRT